MIKKETYADQIYEEIKKDILYHRIGFGERLINRELQKRYGVSSTPVRDAINKLYLDGFIEEITKAGAKVVDFDRDFALEVNEIISLLSDHALKMSSTKSDINEVSEILAQKLKLQKQNRDNDNYFKYDNEFHLTFFYYSHNKRFCDLYERYNIFQEILIRYTYMVNMAKELHRDNAIAQHEQIYLAYKRGEIASARKLMENHYITAVSQIQTCFPLL